MNPLKYLIVSDIHGNWEALTAVLEDAGGQYETILCCGDLVGYGADPNRVTEWARQSGALVIRGNHDRACASLTGVEWFNPWAQAATRWTNAVLSPENRTWLETLPSGPRSVEDFQIVHGSPANEDEYVLTLGDAAEVFAHAQAALIFFGHTHVQCAFEHSRMRTWRLTETEPRGPIHVEETSAYLINPGSVGQPRDGDWRAAYALFDSSSRLITLHRVAYDVATAQQKIIDANLPPVLAERLSSGH